MFSSVITGHVVLPDLLQCFPSPGISDSLQVVWGRGRRGDRLYQLTLSPLSLGTTWYFSVYPLTLQLMFPIADVLCPQSHMKELWYFHGSRSPWREHWYLLIGIGENVSNSILVRCGWHLNHMRTRQCWQAACLSVKCGKIFSRRWDVPSKAKLEDDTKLDA